MKKVVTGETYIEDVLNHKLRGERASGKGEQSAVKTEHFVVKDGVVIPWDIAMDRVKKLAFIDGEKKRE